MYNSNGNEGNFDGILILSAQGMKFGKENIITYLKSKKHMFANNPQVMIDKTFLPQSQRLHWGLLELVSGFWLQTAYIIIGSATTAFELSYGHLIATKYRHSIATSYLRSTLASIQASKYVAED